MLATRPFLFREEPHFVDFDLWGMLANFLYSGHYQLPAAHGRLQRLVRPHVQGRENRSQQ